MNKLIAIVFCLAIATIDAWQTPDQIDSDPVKAEAQIKESWHKFKAEFKKDLHSTAAINNQDDEAKRFFLFRRNYLFMVEHNAKYARGEVSYQLGMTTFADWSEEEVSKLKFSKLHKSDLKSESKKLEISAEALKQIPASVDWTAKGVVNLPPRFQGCCKASWAFATTSALESAIAIKTGKLPALSDQYVLDCLTDFKSNFGCSGGDPDATFALLKKLGFLPTLDAYPLEFYRQDSCMYNTSMAALNFTIASHVYLKENNETTLQYLVATVGPVVTSLNVDWPGFSMYRGGLLDHPECDNAYTKVAVTVVGYGKDSATGKDYWLVKNSWGRYWGEKGMLRIARNANNQCGISNTIMYPVLA